jgi:stage II sporulation protein P
MSRYKSFSVHSGICSCRKAIASAAAVITAAALPLTILGVGTVGAILFRISSLSAHSMMPDVNVTSSALEQESIQEETPSEDEQAVSSEEKKASGGKESSETSSDASSQTETKKQNKDSGKGKVQEKQIKNSGYNYKNVYVKDGNSNYDLNIKTLLNSDAKCKIKKNAGYQVLIIHTHTTESYADKDQDWYSKKYNHRTTDKSESVVAVADEIEKKLNKAGIRTLHITTYHDYPEYTGAYDRARKTIKKYLKKYPSIEMVIDVHRDSMTTDDGTKIKPTAKIDGKKAAQVMIITGCDNEGKLDFGSWRDNSIMAVQLQKKMADKYEGLARPLYFAPFRYNMDLTPNSLLIEFGTDVNTLSEAKYSGQLVGNCLVEVLNGYVVD